MSKTKAGTEKFNTEALLKSKAFSSYQRDFARVLLTGTEYTVEEAKNILQEFYGRKEQ